MDRSGLVFYRTRFRRLFQGPYGEVATYETFDYRVTPPSSDLLLQDALPMATSAQDLNEPAQGRIDPLSAVTLSRVYRWPTAFAVVWMAYDVSGTAQGRGALFRSSDGEVLYANDRLRLFGTMPKWFQDTWQADGTLRVEAGSPPDDRSLGLPGHLLAEHIADRANTLFAQRDGKTEVYEDIASRHYGMGRLVHQIRRGPDGAITTRWLRFPALPADRHLAELDGDRFTF